MIDKELIKRNFSTYARYYDRYSSVQNLCALQLIDKIKVNSFAKILDIGCGTGNYTRLLRNKFPDAKIKALDISQEMVEVAKRKLQGKRIQFITADAETIDFKELFDFITSNASFQWLEDLGRTLTKYSGMLTRNGIISFSIFGPITFRELSASLKELYGKEISISSCNFVDKTRIEEILRRAYRKVIVEEKILREEYISLLELLTKIRYTGARGNGTKGKGFWTLKAIDKLEGIYRAKFGKIVATYQSFFCQAVR